MTEFFEPFSGVRLKVSLGQSMTDNQVLRKWALAGSVIKCVVSRQSNTGCWSIWGSTSATQFG